MKKITLFLLLFMAAAVNAQIVNIPDANFKAALVSMSSQNTFIDLTGNGLDNVDTNGDGEVQLTEAQNIATLNINDTAESITSIIGISAFTNLTSFTIQANSLHTIDISVLTQLEYFNCTGISIETLNVTGLNNLTYLYFNGGDLEAMDLSTLTGLVDLDLDNVSLPTINFGSLPGLYSIDINSSTIATLDFTGCTSLYQLLINGNYGSIDVSGCINLQSLAVGSNQSPVLNMGILPNLNLFQVSGPFHYIDLSGCPQLSSLGIMLTNATQDTYINLKNGNSLYNDGGGLQSDSEQFKCYVCVDEGEVDNLDLSGENLILSTYCTFTPGGDYNTITGTVTFDADNNGCNASDAIFPFAAVQINNGIIQGSSFGSNGTYNFYTQAGTFTLTPQFENGWFTASPETVTFTDNNNNTATQNFCVTANGVHNDAEVTIVPLIAARPGFDATYKIIYRNKGNQTLSGDVAFTYNDAVLDYMSAVPVETTSATGSLSWNYTNLLPFESREILLTLNVNSPMETPAVNIDDALNFVTTITPVTGDETPDDNAFGLKQIVVGSYDPNDITCLEGNTVHPDKIGGYLHYNINFENTGTAPATFVVVKDIIDETKFDVSSLVVLNASHAVETRVTGNKVEFYFGDINLAANGGKGNVTFKIKSLESLTVNSSVMQKADIFFDYNWPIVTNEAVTTYAVLNTPGFSKDASVKIYPNPAKNVLSISAESAIQSIQLFDVQGRLLEATSVNDISTTLDIASRAKGIYFIKIATDEGVNVEKLVKE